MTNPAATTFSASVQSANSVSAELLFVPVMGPDDQLADLPGLAASTRDELSLARAAREFTGAANDLCLARVSGTEWAARRIAFVGVGADAALDVEHLRRAAQTAGYAARQRSVPSIGWVVRTGIATEAQVVADGLSAAEFDGATYRSGRDNPAAYPSRITIVLPGGRADDLEAQVTRGRVVGEAVNCARAWANEPSNVLTPAEFARRVQSAAVQVGLGAEVLDEGRIADLGMRLLLAVAAGSAEPPRFIVLRHDPPNASAAPVLALIGKGVTFDTGGVSIKPAEGMDRMKSDMTGGASVAAAMVAIARLKVPVRVVGLIPVAENMVGGRAMRPGDVVRGASGTTVEILNTDAEGRLILADALWYAREVGATHLLDVATLTGACMIALGRTVSGLFGSPDGWVEDVRRAAAAAGERVWPLPIYEESAEQLKSEIADVVNHAGRPGAAITAAAFLRVFSGGLPWAHLDIAGTAWAETKKAYQPKGATGVAIRTLIEAAVAIGRPKAAQEG